jgi:hypothetical protein
MSLKLLDTTVTEKFNTDKKKVMSSVKQCDVKNLWEDIFEINMSHKLSVRRGMSAFTVLCPIALRDNDWCGELKHVVVSNKNQMYKNFVVKSVG